jgi:hypothetical protein
MARPTTNLLQKLNEGSDTSDGYAKRSWNDLTSWLQDLHAQSRTTKGLLALPPNGPESNLLENSDYRIDCQGIFSVEGFPNITWYNIQIQENRNRGKGKSKEARSTTVMTTYVHKQGYDREDEPKIDASIILRKMWSQALNAIPEMSIFLRDEIGKVTDSKGRSRTARTFEIKTVQRSPHGILTYNATPAYGIWVPQAS